MQVLDSMFANVASGAAKEPLKQDLMEGVDEEEWVRTVMTMRAKRIRYLWAHGSGYFWP